VNGGQENGIGIASGDFLDFGDRGILCFLLLLKCLSSGVYPIKNISVNVIAEAYSLIVQYDMRYVRLLPYIAMHHSTTKFKFKIFSRIPQPYPFTQRIPSRLAI
jgi:hypothetical protein